MMSLREWSVKMYSKQKNQKKMDINTEDLTFDRIQVSILSFIVAMFAYVFHIYLSRLLQARHSITLIGVFGSLFGIVLGMWDLIGYITEFCTYLSVSVKMAFLLLQTSFFFAHFGQKARALNPRNVRWTWTQILLVFAVLAYMMHIPLLMSMSIFSEEQCQFVPEAGVRQYSMVLLVLTNAITVLSFVGPLLAVTPSNLDLEYKGSSAASGSQGAEDSNQESFPAREIKRPPNIFAQKIKAAFDPVARKIWTESEKKMPWNPIFNPAMAKLLQRTILILSLCTFITIIAFIVVESPAIVEAEICFTWIVRGSSVLSWFLATFATPFPMELGHTMDPSSQKSESMASIRSSRIDSVVQDAEEHPHQSLPRSQRPQTRPSSRSEAEDVTVVTLFEGPDETPRNVSDFFSSGYILPPVVLPSAVASSALITRASPTPPRPPILPNPVVESSSSSSYSERSHQGYGPYSPNQGSEEDGMTGTSSGRISSSYLDRISRQALSGSTPDVDSILPLRRGRI